MLDPRHCGWCGGDRRPVLLLMASGMDPTSAAAEVGRSRGYALSSLRGARSRGCLPAITPPPPGAHCAWCEAPVRLPILRWAREGLSNQKTADKLRINIGTVAGVVSQARKRGCLPQVQGTGHTRGPSTVRFNIVCKWCKEPAVAKRAGTEYCGPKCGRAGRDAGLRTNNAWEDCREYGPAEPLIKPDVAGMERRALEAAMDGVDFQGMYERFPPKMAERAIAEARRLGYRAPSYGRGLGSALAHLPVGIPA